MGVLDLKGRLNKADSGVRVVRIDDQPRRAEERWLPDRPDGSEQHRCRVLGKPLRGQWTLDIALRLHHLRRHPLGTNQTSFREASTADIPCRNLFGAVFPLPGNASRGADTSAPLYMNYSTL